MFVVEEMTVPLAVYGTEIPLSKRRILEVYFGRYT